MASSARFKKFAASKRSLPDITGAFGLGRAADFISPIPRRISNFRQMSPGITSAHLQKMKTTPFGLAPVMAICIASAASRLKHFTRQTPADRQGELFGVL